MIKLAVLALALLPAVALAQEYPPCPAAVTSLEYSSGCLTMCRHLSGTLMATPVKCSVSTGEVTALQAPTCSMRDTAEQMLARCKPYMTINQCLQYLASEK